MNFVLADGQGNFRRADGSLTPLVSLAETFDAVTAAMRAKQTGLRVQSVAPSLEYRSEDTRASDDFVLNGEHS